jgi:hypothetical protein
LLALVSCRRAQPIWCHTVTTTVQTDDGRMFGRRERRCDIARRPSCRILTMTVHTDDGRMFARRERRCS